MYDYLFVGGGLASGLTAQSILRQDPTKRVLVIEAGDTLGGNHTWSFFRTDLTETQFVSIAPLIVHEWDGYEVRFPARNRALATHYCSTDSTRFHAVMSEVLRGSIRIGTQVADVSTTGVRLVSGEEIQAACIVDCRGPESTPHLQLGFQKFTGQVWETASPHGLARPIIMDASVPQDGDYRFVYVLPTGVSELMIEDTRYSNSPAIKGAKDVSAIRAYAETAGWSLSRLVREEQGALPIVLGGDIDALWRAADGLPKLGLRAALFHATTGYSFADAVRTAEAFAERKPRTTADAFEFVRQRSIDHWQGQAYWRLLNRMLFMAAEPDARWIIMQRFYGLSEPLIERFYAGRSSWTDKARILLGKPPVAIGSALRCVPETSAIRFSHQEAST